MRCAEALSTWQQALLGQPVDQVKLEEASTHIGACQELCARTRSAAPEDDRLYSPEQCMRLADTSERLGRRDADEARMPASILASSAWQKGARRAPSSARAERTMALASWQSAAAYYHDGLRISKTAHLAEGSRRSKQKRLETGSNRALTKPGTAGLACNVLVSE